MSSRQCAGNKTWSPTQRAIDEAAVISRAGVAHPADAVRSAVDGFQPVANPTAAQLFDPDVRAIQWLIDRGRARVARGTAA